ncbi:MAG: ABC transporter ATP-binding protein [Loktanella sp.]|nr:ABC transporter ATP-binding protein [Loktanella sp.]
MSRILLEGVTKRFGDHLAVDALDMEIPSGAFFSLLGPSGCGKTTLMRLIAGFETLDAGRIVIGDRVVADARNLTHIPPAQRGLGMVFQSYALWPHMSVRDNVLFGLRTRKVAKADQTARLHDTLETVQLGDLGDRFPSELSGGQQQRVALARELITDPAVLMLDEPLSNLDAQLRQDMRLELRRLHARTGRSFVYVTHDQLEALSLSSLIMVMRAGKMEQIGAPDDIYADPQSLFVAEFLGHGKLNTFPNGPGVPLPLPGTARDRDVYLAIRPEDLEIADRADDWTRPAQVTAKLPMGSVQVLALSFPGDRTATLEAPRHTQLPDAGTEVLVRFSPRRLMAFDPATGQRLAFTGPRDRHLKSV